MRKSARPGELPYKTQVRNPTTLVFVLVNRIDIREKVEEATVGCSGDWPARKQVADLVRMTRIDRFG